MNRIGKIRLFSLSALAVSVLPATQAGAAGFQVGEHSAAGSGRAFAGEAAMADNASVLASNTAGMSLLNGRVFTGAVSYIKPDIEV